jgi:biopolymer transport protein TolR
MAGGIRGRDSGIGRRRSFRPMAEINVTPMVDVMLVLLVIFMVTAPLLTAGVPVELPKTNSAPLKGDDQPLSVSLKSDGTIWLQETQVQLEELGPRLQAITSAKPDTRIFVRADGGANYGQVAAVLSQLQQSGFEHVALVTQPGPPTSSRKGTR